MQYLAVLGRQKEISLAELEALFNDVQMISDGLAVFTSKRMPEISRLGGTLKVAEKIKTPVLEFLAGFPDGKITFGVSDYSKKASKKSANLEAMKLKKILVRHGRSVRVVANTDAILGTATSLHNGLYGKSPRKAELIKIESDWYRVIGVQDIDAYSRRDQARPARDAKVGMLPPKLAQILINLCGCLPKGSCVLDPFCGTGVVLQEALLMGYRVYGTDISEKMVEYSRENLEWLVQGKFGIAPSRTRSSQPVVTGETSLFSLPLSRDGSQRSYFQISQGDATSCQWERSIDAVACECYLGKPMSRAPTEMELKEQKQECGGIILGFLKNLYSQIEPGTPVTIAMPAWLTENGEYSRLQILDEIKDMGYNVSNKSCEGLLYHREGQIVARDIIILRKK